MKTIGYLRVSTDKQDLEKNKAAILNLANEKNLGKVEWVEEKISGTVSWKKRKLFDHLQSLSKGDSIIVSEISRLGRSLMECMEILSIASRREIRIYSVKGDWQLDGSIQSKVMATVFSLAAEIERDLISTRTKEALAARKAKGLPLGRPKGPGKSKLDKFRPEIEALLANGSTQRFIAKRYKIRPESLCRWIKKRGIGGKNTSN